MLGLRRRRVSFISVLAQGCGGWEDAEMEKTLEAAALPRRGALQLPAAAALAALGVVYGDIGTSPLYAFKQAAGAGGVLSPETIMGIVSVILWSLIVIVSFKYAILIMRADNRREGGIVALLALLDVRHAPAGSWRASLLIVGLIGAALLYGDGVITPAISVLSAVEGLKVDAPQLAPVVVPISIAILIGLFLVQRKGTAFIGNIFGPVMLIWFIAIGLLGLRGIIAAPGILSALSPHHAMIYLLHAGPGIGFAFLMLTWRTGYQLLEQQRSRMRQREDEFTDWVLESRPIRLPGAAAIFTAGSSGIPLALTHHLRHNRVLHERMLLVSTTTTDAPRVDPGERVKLIPVGAGITRVVLHFGFMEHPNIMEGLVLACRDPALRGIDPKKITFYTRRVMVVANGKVPGMAVWRERIFAAMHLNANLPAAYFGVPTEQIVEVGLEVEI
jgi:K+ transporter